MTRYNGKTHTHIQKKKHTESCLWNSYPKNTETDFFLKKHQTNPNGEYLTKQPALKHQGQGMTEDPDESRLQDMTIKCNACFWSKSFICEGHYEDNPWNLKGFRELDGDNISMLKFLILMIVPWLCRRISFL